jgi:hypothetical protein
MGHGPNGTRVGKSHTSEKKQNAGPYSNNGFQPEPFTSHLDFVEGGEVIYTGSSSKNKNKRNVPNGAVGTVVAKDIKRLQKSSRSTILVDFGSHGARYVNKNCLMFPSDDEKCMKKRLDSPPVILGLQSDRVEARVKKKEKNMDKTVESIMKKREEQKEYRQFRKDLLDKKELELGVEISRAMNDPKNVKLRDERKKINESIEEIKEMYTTTKEPLTKLEYMKSKIDGTHNQEQLESMFNVHKDQDMRRIKLLKQHLLNVSDELKGKSKELGNLEKAYNSGSRSFFMNECASPHDYRRMVHEAWNKKPVPSNEPSMKYEIVKDDEKDEKKPVKEPPNMDLLKWGLYPRDVGL